MTKSPKQKEASRKKSLGELGELFAIKALMDKEYENIKNFNDDKRNFPFADLYAEKDNKKYVISIKARNKYEKRGTENNSYNLGKKAYKLAEEAGTKYNAEAYWMAIAFDIQTFSVYFGSMKELNERNAIPIQECKKGLIGECLVSDKRHYFDWSFFINK